MPTVKLWHHLAQGRVFLTVKHEVLWLGLSKAGMLSLCYTPSSRIKVSDGTDVVHERSKPVRGFDEQWGSV